MARRKRSITIAKHRTSISLEQPFWDALHAYAEEDGRSVADLVSEVDKKRERAAPGASDGAPELNLSAALRLYVLERMAGKS